MPDFHQNIVPTFTHLETEDLGQLEKSIQQSFRRTPVGVIVPALFQDLSSPAMRHIIDELSSMQFVKRVYVSLDRASKQEFQRACQIVKPLGEAGVLLWNDAPEVQAVVQKINDVLPVGPRGKGQAIWTALGYALGKGEVAVIAFHDADIVTYDRGFLLRLLYPVVHLRYQFAKGFYAPCWQSTAARGCENICPISGMSVTNSDVLSADIIGLSPAVALLIAWTTSGPARNVIHGWSASSTHPDGLNSFCRERFTAGTTL